ncbi:MAG: hypothetical protein ABIF85_02805 [Nanoarchaeota archaeon]|nr:hypothetical protein [Nanoarchaeota archaeon]MBU4451569.1 hypothetical protein [Nanoarchaeota archaeon]MCG2724353.1 hypothetical protein [archaeon]
MWLELFTNLGFLGFYTLWAFLVGSIAVFGLLRGLVKRGHLENIILSWFVGAILVTASPIGSLVFAGFFRLIAEGIKITGLRKGIKRIHLMDEETPPTRLKFAHPKLFAGTIAILIFLGITTLIFAPPLEVDWYKMRGSDTVIVEDAKSTLVLDIKWEDIQNMRLVSQEYALQVPKTMVTETGWSLSSDWDGIYSINNTLYWVMAYEPARLANNGEPSPAYIIVNAQNPSDRKKINENIEFSEERRDFVSLAYQIATGKIRDVKTKYWMKYPFFTYGDTVFTHDSEGSPVWFAPVKMRYPTKFIVKFYTEQVGIVVLNNNGVVTFYSEAEIRSGNAPKWLLEGQVLIDEDYSEERAAVWAKYASWKGFLNYYLQHENVFELARNMYFQYDKDTGRTYGLLQLEPEGRTRKAITQYIEIQADGKDYGTAKIYDTRTLGLIGPERALDDVRGEISLYSDWYALQPLFKKIKDGYFYVAPVYSGVREAMVLKAVAVVDAKSEQVKLFGWGAQNVEGGKAAVSDKSDTDNAANKTSAFGDNCTIASSKTIGKKLQIVVECG